MTRTSECIRLVAGSLVAVTMIGLGAGRAHAIEPRALAPFQVQAPDGSNVGSGQVALAGRQVLIYVDADCPACGMVFTALAGLGPEQAVAVTFIVNGDAEAATRLMSRLPATLAGVRWFTDERGSAYTAMKLQVTPTVIGLWAGQVHWARPGSTTDVAALRSALRSWLGPLASAPDEQRRGSGDRR